MEKILVYFTIAVVCLASFRILLYWIMLKLTSMKPKKKKLTAEEIILGKGVKQIKPRPKEVEAYYLILRDYFKSMLQEKKLSRKDLLNIKKYIKENLSYEKKKYNSDAHFIYSTLKYSHDLTLQHVLDLVKYLETVEHLKVKESTNLQEVIKETSDIKAEFIPVNVDLELCDIKNFDIDFEVKDIELLEGGNKI